MIFIKKYNNVYVETFTEEEYKNALSNKQYLKKIIQQYSNKYTTDKKIVIDANDIIFKESLDHYVLKQIQENPNFVESNDFLEYINYIYELYIVSDIELNVNVIFNDEKLRNIIESHYFPKEKDKIEKAIEKNNAKYNIIISKIVNKEKLTQEELNYITEYMSKNKDITKSDKETIIKYIFGQMKDDNLKFTYQVQDCILSYLPMFYSKTDVENSRIVLCDLDHTKKIDGSAQSNNKNNYVAINKNYFENIKIDSIDDSKIENKELATDFTNFIFVACHELFHQHQYKLSKKKYLNDSGFAHIIYAILEKNLKDYNKNHDSSPLEIDANENGWIESQYLYDKFYSGNNRNELLNNCRNNSQTSKYRRIFAFKEDSNKNIIPYDEYDIENLIQILRKNPGYLKIYPMLNSIFNEKGKIKLSAYTDNYLIEKENCSEIINYFFKNNGPELMIKYINKHELDIDKQNILIDNLYSFIINKYQVIDKINHISKSNNFGEYISHHQEKYKLKEIIHIHICDGAEAYKKVIPLFELIKIKYPSQEKNINNKIERIEKQIENVKKEYNLFDSELNSNFKR